MKINWSTLIRHNRSQSIICINVNPYYQNSLHQNLWRRCLVSLGKEKGAFKGSYNNIGFEGSKFIVIVQPLDYHEENKNQPSCGLPKEIESMFTNSPQPYNKLDQRGSQIVDLSLLVEQVGFPYRIPPIMFYNKDSLIACCSFISFKLSFLKLCKYT